MVYDHYDYDEVKKLFVHGLNINTKRVVCPAKVRKKQRFAITGQIGRLDGDC